MTREPSGEICGDDTWTRSSMSSSVGGRRSCARAVAASAVTITRAEAKRQTTRVTMRPPVVGRTRAARCGATEKTILARGIIPAVSDMSPVLWRPSADRVAAANLTEFGRDVETAWQVSVPDYAALHRFSVEQPERFWSMVWRYGGVLGTPGGRVVEHADRMPGARFFPDARLNFAENLLR